MHPPAPVARVKLLQPGQHLGRGVRGQVVQYDVDLLAGVRLHGFVQEVEEVLPGPGGAALAEHLAGFHVERSEQVRRAVPDVQYVLASFDSYGGPGSMWTS